MVGASSLAPRYLAPARTQVRPKGLSRMAVLQASSCCWGTTTDLMEQRQGVEIVLAPWAQFGPTVPRAMRSMRWGEAFYGCALRVGVPLQWQCLEGLACGGVHPLGQEVNACVGGNAKTRGLASGEQEVLRFESACGPYGESRQVVHKCGAAYCVHNWVISNVPQKHAGRSSHPNAAEHLADGSQRGARDATD